jgi:iron complex outermembrane receptor protein
VYEVGYRGQPTRRISYSATAFHSIYDHLRTQELAASRRSVFYANEMEGKSSGIEMWGAYQASDRWRLSGGWTALRERLRLKPGSSDTAGLAAQQGRDPAHSWMLRSSVNLPYQSELDATLRHVSALSSPAVPAYSAVDLRLGWRPRRDLEVSVTGRNLFASGHAEFTDADTRTQFARSLFVNVLNRF